NSAAPTDVLCLTRIQEGSRKLGLLIHNLQNASEIRIVIDTEFSLDPWLASELGTKLRALGEKLDGVFESWSLVPKQPFPAGVRDITLKLVGSFVQWHLTIHANLGGVLFQQMAGPTGLPVELTWVYTDDNSVKGDSFVVRLSLSKQQSPEIAIQSGKIRNLSGGSIGVDYVRIKDRFVALQPALGLS